MKTHGLQSLVGAALLIGVATSAFAQDGSVEKHVIIRGPDGTKEIVITGDAPTNADGQVIVFSINGNGGNFTFVGSPNDLPFGGGLGPMGLMMLNGGANGSLSIVDPGISYIHQLVKRPDVRSELFIDSKQREQLEAMEAEQNAANQARATELKNSIRGLQGGRQQGGLVIQGGPPPPGAAAGGAQGGAAAGSADQNGLADRIKSLRDLTRGQGDGIDKKLAEILTEKQIKRLKELDLQYRGPLAMGVKPVADKAKLTDKQEPFVADLLNQYRFSVRKALGVEEKTTNSTGPDGSRTVNVNSSIQAQSPEELRARIEKAHDEIEQSRRTLGDKALKSVTDDQRSEWKALTGVRFRFQNLN